MPVAELQQQPGLKHLRAVLAALAATLLFGRLRLVGINLLLLHQSHALSPFWPCSFHVQLYIMSVQRRSIPSHAAVMNC